MPLCPHGADGDERKTQSQHLHLDGAAITGSLSQLAMESTQRVNRQRRSHNRRRLRSKNRPAQRSRLPSLVTKPGEFSVGPSAFRPNGERHFTRRRWQNISEPRALFRLGKNNASQVPYTQVFAEYANAYRQAIDSGQVPPQLRDLIRQYFSSLEP